MSARTRLSLFAVAAVLLAGCSKDSLTTQPLAGLNAAGGTLAAQTTITVPAGSVDALAAALAAAGPGGKAVLASGNHTESASVVITQPVTIEGESGAVLTSSTSPVLILPTPLDVALHVKGAAGVTIQGLEIVPADAIGGTAILLENAPGAIVRGNHLREHQYGVLVYESDKSWIDGNTVVTSAAWQTAEIPEALGITVISGEKVRVTGNESSQGLFNIWACDKDGTLQSNRVHDGFIGIIFCKVPEGEFALPDGTPAFAEFSATNWMCKRNDARNNLDAGYLVIDGSTHNMLVENKGSGNGTYDIDLSGPTSRFGYPVPGSYFTTVRVGSESTLRIKDCGENNTVIRGNQIDTTVDTCN